jgi:hypothetical protein
MVELALVGGPLGAHARRPFRHVAGLGRIQPEAEAIAFAPVGREDARDERFLACREPHGMDVNEVRLRHGRQYKMPA